MHSTLNRMVLFHITTNDAIGKSVNLHTNSYLLIYINENPKAIYYNNYARDKINMEIKVKL